MAKIKYYFGTDNHQAGHYMWEVKDEGNYISNRSLDFKPFAFHPEYLTQGLQKGEVAYSHHISRKGEFTVLAITGSAVDDRPGCKSVFIVEGIIPFAEIQDLVKACHFAKVLIEKMPFEIKW